jgi:CRISPR-associated protein Csb3
MTKPEIRIPVDLTNPGQFLACCGLLELAHRKSPGSDGWFASNSFCVTCAGSLADLLAPIATAAPVQLDHNNDMASPLHLPSPFNLRLDWWNDEVTGSSAFKTWAGQQKVVRIVAAMHAVLASETISPESLLNSAAVLYDRDEKNKPVEPFYFDARRASQAHSLDVGFSPDAHDMKVPVFTAVEFLCLIGLQRFRPIRRDDGCFGYGAWSWPLTPACAAAVAAGAVSAPGVRAFAFPVLYRTKYLKGFLPATQIGESA